jgi:uncharacterized protein
MDKEDTIRIVRRYAEELSRKMKVKQVYLYGSYARDSAHIDSDIDVAVVVDKIQGDFLDTEIMLFRTRRDIDERIEPVLINENNDRSGFLEDIKKYGLSVYG